MSALKWIFAAVVCGLFSTVFAAQPGGITVSHYESLQRLSVQTAVAKIGPGKSETAPVRLGFDALGRSFDFQLEPNSGLLSRASRAALPDGVGVYRGDLAGVENSWARIVIVDGVPSGVFWDGQQMYAIEAPGNSLVQSGAPIVYRLADTFIEPGTMSCGTLSLSGNGAAAATEKITRLNIVDGIFSQEIGVQSCSPSRRS